MGRLCGWVAGTAAALALALAPAAAAETPAETAAAIPTPSCAEGPVREGDVMVGTACADHIVVPPAVTYVDGGPGDDTIVGSFTTAASGDCGTFPGCHLEVGSQTFEGGEGDDIVYGDRGNDILRGNAGDDRLYGGIGDDRLEGGPGNDWLSGGFGADTIDGGEGNDYVRGDGTIDHIFDTGTAAVESDTLSYASGVTPGFGTGKIPTGTGIPAGTEGERGVVINLSAGGENADNGVAASGGGVDEVQPGAFERIIGTPFSDYIVGSGKAEEIIGGGGADVLKGGGGADVLRGGADGDFLEAAAGSHMFGESPNAMGKDTIDYCTGGGIASECESTTAEAKPRATGKVSVGEVAAGSGATDVYLVGSSGADVVVATDTGSAVEFTLTSGTFDQSREDAAACSVSEKHAACPLTPPAQPSPVPALDALVIAGMDGNDTIAASNFPDETGLIELGGAGEDTLTGGPAGDVLVDGPPPNNTTGATTDTSRDFLHAEAGDDALLHSGGADELDGGPGSDLFLSVEVCEGETIKGGTSVGGDRDNASWARLGNGGVYADVETGIVGRVTGEEGVSCPGGPASEDHMEGIEDLEGSEGNDVLFGDGGTNQLLGHRGEDIYRALAGDDSIFANSGSRDKVIDCGEGTDSAVIDLASVGDPAPINCESVREGKAEEFRTEIEEPVPVTVAPPLTTPTPTPKPKPDHKPPLTRLLGRTPKLIRLVHGRRAAVAFRFAASESSRFECKLDRKPYRRCRSPLRARLGAGAHTFRVFAIDAAGNRDRTPAIAHLRVVVRRR